MAQDTQTKTSTSTTVGVTVALLGAAALAAAGLIATDAQKQKKVNNVTRQAPPIERTLDTDALTGKLKKSKKVILNRQDGLVVRGHTTATDRSTGTVETVRFTTDIFGDVTQSVNELQKFYSWPLRVDKHPGSSQIENQVVLATRLFPNDLKLDNLDNKDQLEQLKDEAKEAGQREAGQTPEGASGTAAGAAAGASQGDGTQGSGTIAGAVDNDLDLEPAPEPKPTGSVLFVKGQNKLWKNTTDPTKNLLEFDRQQPPYEKQVKKVLGDSYRPNDAIWNFLVETSNAATGYGVGATEWEMTGAVLSRAELLPLMTAVQGMMWAEYLPETEYTVQATFDIGTNDLHRIYINGNDVDIHLYFANGETFLQPVTGWVDESVLDVKNYFLDNSAYSLPAELMKNYSFYHLAYDVSEVDRWYYEAPKELTPPDRTTDNPADSSTTGQKNPQDDKPKDGSSTNTSQPEEAEQPETVTADTSGTDATINYGASATASDPVDYAIILK